MLGLDDSGIISFEDFNKRILKEEQRPTTVHSFSEQQMSEVVYLLDTVKGAVWVRSKVCFQETDKEGHTNVYGIAELQEAPNMTSAYQPCSTANASCIIFISTCRSVSNYTMRMGY